MISTDILLDKLSKIEHLTIKCQSCNFGQKVLKKDKYFEAESALSRNEFTQEINGFYTKIHKRFSAGLVCTNPDCQDISIITGNINSVLEFKNIEYQGISTYAPIYKDKINICSIIPSLHLFNISNYRFGNQNIIHELEDAFSVFWHRNCYVLI